MFCSRCGLTIARASPFCTACGQATGVGPAQGFPAVPAFARISPAAASGGVAYAGVWLRFLAWMIDQVLVGGMALVILGRLISLARVGYILQGLEPLDDPGEVYALLGLGATLGFV